MFILSHNSFIFYFFFQLFCLLNLFFVKIRQIQSSSIIFVSICIFYSIFELIDFKLIKFFGCLVTFFFQNLIIVFQKIYFLKFPVIVFNTLGNFAVCLMFFLYFICYIRWTRNIFSQYICKIILFQYFCGQIIILTMVIFQYNTVVLWINCIKNSV
ncbi:hypothetical protein IMG5_172540 [Ichthyophthirius multifiliis]|uniref:Transmembrane protein n=1 Tax=Ichthyophthirius multifiliis TaxID=5932 RepID=G0R1S8_ICHMU|nr:hypothetical protein IMG5_172540 [Ichthyophthirius multifiliis]EGR28580.1 hypothetical protein IMG5_172540 [Ichthyophthirius multifiliis]|eukprot:XP_004029816.1 hypothetical protein IMG5_172540 [Ichthyophthirius multifiliis]